MTLKTKIKIVMADDHGLIRQGYKSILEKIKDFEIVGEAENGKDLLDVIHLHQPDIAIVDIEMPVMNGRESILQMKKLNLKVKPIVLSMHFSEHYISQLILSGACAYLTKNSEAEEVVETIRKVDEDGFYFNDRISQKVLDSVAKSRKLEENPGSHTLSPREVEVLRQICAGHKNKEIAAILNITVNTVDFHRNNIFEKSGANNIVQLVKYAIRNGFANID
ncbi:MAG: hypothetical protein JWO32_2946 [Bacteroidetes bacterium]|nr:hypothetical protein [Bacteroidota bacterium]